MRDFYLRDSSDPNHRQETLEISDELEELVYQIKMMLLTNRGSVFGEPNFGMSLELYLFDTDFNGEALSKAILRQINVYCEIARSYNLGVRVQRVRDQKFRDAVLIDITLEGQSIFGFVF